MIIKLDYMWYKTIADNNGCKVNLNYEPPEDGIVRAETYVGG
jgi:hypothetical protein